eukprot:CAMPEP_0170739478 /NCGR_PEP_ID=MMETSP0437-20130122/5185_1 /TAXON_ID=0 /ORGANISM="Sexangularia sp." /LENGTH=146 /DNA_ID=CAMNT_0011077941 /DNA_START=202 /DNA_END=638 /DNA_ORIENTATION=+
MLRLLSLCLVLLSLSSPSLGRVKQLNPDSTNSLRQKARLAYLEGKAGEESDLVAAGHVSTSDSVGSYDPSSWSRSRQRQLNRQNKLLAEYRAIGANSGESSVRGEPRYPLDVTSSLSSSPSSSSSSSSSSSDNSHTHQDHHTASSS